MVNKNQDQRNTMNKKNDDNRGNRAQGVDPKAPKMDQGKSDLNSKNTSDQKKPKADIGSGMSTNQKRS